MFDRHLYSDHPGESSDNMWQGKGKLLFLLGGYDLEMVTIRDLLLKVGFQDVTGNDPPFPERAFADRRLTWGALLSSYKSELNAVKEQRERTVVAVELTEDIPAPENYVVIDHHNERSHLPSSIEQTAAFLGLNLSRYQRLVAANDRGYIPEMMKMGVTVDEIEKIRKKDRKAQGVTSKDEKMAEISVRDKIEFCGRIAIVRSLTDKFSPIVDRLHGKAEKLLIISSAEIGYFGPDADSLAGHFSKSVQRGNAYYGGGKNGYFILKYFSNEARDQLLNEIMKIIK